MAAAKIEIEEIPCCPICLEEFNIPRQLPCSHSFCENCLQSHITTEATKYSKLCFFKCPVCRTSASPSIKDRPTSEWASLFPAKTVLQSVLTKSKVDRLCDACNTEADAVPAEGFCVFCKEVMCVDCLKLHRRQKISKDHTIISVEELASNPESAMKLAEGFTCSEHDGEDIKYYCKDHKVDCCGTCFFEGHKMCSTIIDLKKELPTLLCDSKPDDTIADMKKFEIYLKTFMEMNEAYVTTLKPQVDRLTNKVREVRKKINEALDQLEILVETEGNRIQKEEVIRIHDENHQCLSLLHAVRNSYCLLEAVNKYGSNLQKLIMSEKVRWQLQSYSSLVEKKYEKTDTLMMEVEFAPPIQSMMSLSLSALGNVVTTASSNRLPLTCSWRPRMFKKVDVIDLNFPADDIPWYTGITFLPGDRVLLADNYNKQCILLSSSYQFITSQTLAYKPWKVCVLDDEEVAVSLYNMNTIQILSVVGDIIRPVRTIKTKYICTGIAAAGKGEMVVHGDCGNDKSQWSLINSRGDVKCAHKYDTTCYHYNYVAVNTRKTRVYISVFNMDSLLCFDMNGRKQFTYSPDNLRKPCGVAVDRYDNIYVVGNNSDNIHQLSPDGSVIKVVNAGKLGYPCAICIHQMEMIADMKKIESHLKKFMESNDSSVNSLEKQVNGLIIEMGNVRKKINDVLDEFEKHMKTEVNRIYKEEVIRKQDENHQCLSLIHAVKNSHCLLEAIDKYGSNL
ncbi:hypothetical protein CHS0354_020693 [Potamilus streckersoni]|uniref:Uncharacterized protein n=1 Tax=Potamilus streckersoni TaxID=2493646 RepID=A0AAE0WD69_9BIVA|nr:hypothetical protein CHS0354_020693 [Potamilus streckersoni]